MVYSFRCPKTGLPDIVDSAGLHKCDCGEYHEAHPCGAPPRQEGFPNVIGDELRKHYDWGAGREFTSKSERRKAYKDKGLTMNSASEHKREHGTSYSKPIAVSYAGQTRHTSTAERQQRQSRIQ